MHSQIKKMAKIKDRSEQLHKQSSSVLHKAIAILNHLKRKARLKREMDHIDKIRSGKK